MDGFRRRDHLTQHLRIYHHLKIESRKDPDPGRVCFTCPYPGCPQSRGPEFFRLCYKEQKKGLPFEKTSDYMKHMREIHDDALFLCDVPGCKKKGGKGYFRERDFIKHRKTVHPEAPPFSKLDRYVSDGFRNLVCEVCGDYILDIGVLVAHYRYQHDYTEYTAFRTSFKPLSTSDPSKESKPDSDPVEDNSHK